MRFLKLKCNFLIFGLIFAFLASTVFGSDVLAKNVDDFYFDDFTGDYYLEKGADGVSKMRVVESFTAVFPLYNQNKGLCRQIPFTNAGGINITLPRLTESDIKVTRNGLYEPIYSIEKEADNYNVCTGTDDYVLGRQVYTFEYTFQRVITEFDGYQELYWDTNGNGSVQKFNELTARVHLVGSDAEKAYAGKKWCYVGRYGESGQERCEISEISDGLEFHTTNLKQHENLTFDIEFKEGSFIVPEPEVSYVLYVLLGVFAAFSGLLLIIPIKNYKKVSDKRKFYKGHFIVPEYQPHNKYTLTEMARLYIGKVKNAKVALLLDMAVKNKIKFIKVKDNKFFRDKWAVTVDDPAMLSENEMIAVKILNGGGDVVHGRQIDIVARTASPSLVALGKKFDKVAIDGLKRKGLVESKASVYNIDNSASGIVSIIAIGFVTVSAMMFVIGCAATLVDMIEAFGSGKILLGEECFILGVPGIAAVIGFIWALLSSATTKYKYRTLEGLEMSRYMDGLKLYISMAEADRIKFMQSKDDVDVSPEGIVKLYEKLLPYAALFGLEKSWMRELDKYYANLDVSSQPEWHRSGLSVSDLVIASTISSTYMHSASTVSGGGGSSSSSSGGGGGGFSGGGGGGGGVGGR